MARCEDYPCCGCGTEGCVDRDRTVKCGDCGRSYHPDQNTEEFCYRCQHVAAGPGPEDDDRDFPDYGREEEEETA